MDTLTRKEYDELVSGVMQKKGIPESEAVKVVNNHISQKGMAIVDDPGLLERTGRAMSSPLTVPANAASLIPRYFRGEKIDPMQVLREAASGIIGSGPDLGTTFKRVGIPDYQYNKNEVSMTPSHSLNRFPHVPLPKPGDKPEYGSAREDAADAITMMAGPKAQEMIGKGVQAFGKGIMRFSPSVTRMNSMLSKEQMPVEDILTRGKAAYTGQGIIDALSVQKKAAEDVKNLIRKGIDDFGMQGNPEKIVQRAQDYVNKIKMNREYSDLAEALQKDIDDTVARYTPKPGRPLSEVMSPSADEVQAIKTMSYDKVPEETRIALARKGLETPYNTAKAVGAKEELLRMAQDAGQDVSKLTDADRVLNSIYDVSKEAERAATAQEKLTPFTKVSAMAMRDPTLGGLYQLGLASRMDPTFMIPGTAVHRTGKILEKTAPFTPWLYLMK